MLVKGPLGIHLNLRPDHNTRSQVRDALRSALVHAVESEGVEQAKQKARTAYPSLPEIGDTPEQVADTLMNWLPRAHEVFHDVTVDRRAEKVDVRSSLDDLLEALTRYGTKK